MSRVAYNKEIMSCLNSLFVLVGSVTATPFYHFRRDFFGRLGPRGGRGRFGFFGPRGGRGFLGLLGGREIELEIGRRRTTDLRCAPNFPLVPRRTRSRLRDKFRLRAARLIRALARRPCL